MGVVACESCGAHVDDEDLLCSSCGKATFTRVDPDAIKEVIASAPVVREKHVRKKSKAPNPETDALIRSFLGYLIKLALCILLVWWLLPKMLPSDVNPTERNARNACDSALRKGSLNSSKVDIPYAKLTKNGEKYILEWPAGRGLRMPNAFGAQLDVFAVCFYDGMTGKIDLIEVNGLPFPH